MRNPIKHGHCSNGMSPEYYAWSAMLERCRNPNNPEFKNYGARGITVCREWTKFENFIADMGLRPPGMTLERIDNESSYSKENCRWATISEQMLNRRKLSGSSKYKGVFWSVSKNRWVARIKLNGWVKQLGSFKEEINAAKAWNAAVLKYRGPDAWFNKIETDAEPEPVKPKGREMWFAKDNKDDDTWYQFKYSEPEDCYAEVIHVREVDE